MSFPWSPLNYVDRPSFVPALPCTPDGATVRHLTQPQPKIATKFSSKMVKAKILPGIKMKRSILTILALATFAFNARAEWVPRHLAELQKQIIALKATVDALQCELVAVRNNPPLALGPFVTVDPNPQLGVVGPNITFKGANIHIESGSGATNDNGNPSGLGNLIIGYDETGTGSNLPPYSYTSRHGSHNLILGRYNTFNEVAWGGIVGGEGNQLNNFGGLVTGNTNLVSGPWCTVLSGFGNEARGTQSCVVGGLFNLVIGEDSVNLSGVDNIEWGLASATLSGGINEDNGFASAVVGGSNNGFFTGTFSTFGVTEAFSVVLGGNGNDSLSPDNYQILPAYAPAASHSAPGLAAKVTLQRNSRPYPAQTNAAERDAALKGVLP
jgi:hypothetical protein